MLEKPMYFAGENYQLFGVVHYPDSNDLKEGVVFCHPFAEEKLWTHRVFVSFARELAKLGYHVLRFDYMGQGDSDGDFEDSTISSRLSDIRSALDYLRQTVPTLESIGLLGLRLGATLAALIAEQQKQDIKKLILWDPVISGSKYMKEILRTNLTTQMATYKKIIKNREALIAEMENGQPVDIDGYYMNYELYREATDIDLKNEKGFLGQCLVVQIGKENSIVRQETAEFSQSYQRAKLDCAIEEPFWKEIKNYYGRAENLSDVTLRWLEDVNG